MYNCRILQFFSAMPCKFIRQWNYELLTFYQSSAEFFYIDVWSSPFTWGGGPLPKEGDLVVITPGQTILLDISTPKLTLLLIQGKSKVLNPQKCTLPWRKIHKNAQCLLRIRLIDSFLKIFWYHNKSYEIQLIMTSHFIGFYHMCMYVIIRVHVHWITLQIL